MISSERIEWDRIGSSWVGWDRFGSLRVVRPDRISWIGSDRMKWSAMGSVLSESDRISSDQNVPGSCQVRWHHFGSDRIGLGQSLSGWVGSNRIKWDGKGRGGMGSDRIGVNCFGSEQIGLDHDRIGLGQMGSNQVGTGRVGSDRVLGRGSRRIGPD